MSADNWTLCPKCEDEKNKKVEELRRKTRDSYGKVPEAEYKALNQKLKRAENTGGDYTLREDYEIGIWKGRFKVDYCACCKKCSYSYRHTHSENIDY